MITDRIVVDGKTYEEGVRCKVMSTHFTHESEIDVLEGHFNRTEVVIDNCWDNTDEPYSSSGYIVSDKEGYGWHPGDLKPISDTVTVTGEVRPI